MDPIVAQLLHQYPLEENTQTLVRLFAINRATGQIRKLVERKNLIVYSGADILAKLLSGASQFAVNAMYLEFLNLADPLDTIVPPAFDRTGGVAYYNGLVGVDDPDFLRISLDIIPSFAASSDLYVNNKVTFFGISEGTTGVNGKPFNPTVNSAVYGAALVAAPDFDDQSQDVVFSRVYSGIDKVLKESGFEIGVTWTIQFN